MIELFFAVLCITTVNIHVHTDEQFLQLTVYVTLGLASCVLFLL